MGMMITEAIEAPQSKKFGIIARANDANDPVKPN